MSESETQPERKRGDSYLYLAAAFVLVIFGLRAAEAIVNPLLLAIFLAVISTPAYFALLKREVSQWLALLIVIGVLSTVMVSVVYIVADSVAGITSRQRHYQDLLRERTNGLQVKLEAWMPDWIKEPEPNDTKPLSEPKDMLPDAASLNALPVPATTDSAAVMPSTEASPSSEPINVTAAEADSRSDIDTDSNPSVPLAEADADLDPDDTRADAADIEMVEEELAEPDFGFRETRKVPRDETAWRKYMSQQFDPGTAISLALSIAGSIGQLLSNVFLILLTVVFILLEAGTFRTKITEAFGQTQDATGRAQQIIHSIRNYLVIKTWISLATGILVTVWLRFLGVPYAGLWGLLAFLFNFIPNIGSIIAAVPAVLIAWLELTTLPAVAAAIGLIAINAVIGNFIEPRLMGRGLGLSPLVVFCCMVFWGWVLGPVGMLLSVPLTMTARIALDGFDDTRWIATLMGNADSPTRA